ncbi:unnamed protein product, partial [Staurois parvus]
MIPYCPGPHEFSVRPCPPLVTRVIMPKSNYCKCQA